MLLTRFEEIVRGFIPTSEAEHFIVFLGAREERCLLQADIPLEAGGKLYRIVRNLQKTGGQVCIVREETKG